MYASRGQFQVHSTRQCRRHVAICPSAWGTSNQSLNILEWAETSYGGPPRFMVVRFG
jgi:hypothetical protein